MLSELSDRMKSRYPTREIDSCMCQVRWQLRPDGEKYLQQLWRIDTVTNGDGSIGTVVDSRVEWRDVPIEY